MSQEAPAALEQQVLAAQPAPEVVQAPNVNGIIEAAAPAQPAPSQPVVETA